MVLLKVTFSNTAHKHATAFQEAILSRLYSWLSSKGICVVSLPEVGKYPVSCCILNEAVSTKQHRERNTKTHEVFITPWLKWPGTGSSGCCKSLWLVSLCIMEDVQYSPDGRQAECFVKRHNVVHGWHDAFKEFWREFKRGNTLFWLIVSSDEVSFKLSAEILREEQMFACVRSLMKPQDIAEASVMMPVTVVAAFCCGFLYSWVKGERGWCSP